MHLLTMMVADMTQRYRLEACGAVARPYEHFQKLENDHRDSDDHGDQTIELVSKGMWSMAPSAPVEPRGLGSTTQGRISPSSIPSLAGN